MVNGGGKSSRGRVFGGRKEAEGRDRRKFFEVSASRVVMLLPRASSSHCAIVPLSCKVVEVILDTFNCIKGIIELLKDQ
jgi:hypothetical protein